MPVCVQGLGQKVETITSLAASSHPSTGLRPPAAAAFATGGRGCVSQKEMHEAVRVFLGIYLSLKMETGFRSLLGEAAMP